MIVYLLGSFIGVRGNKQVIEEKFREEIKKAEKRFKVLSGKIKII